MVLHLLNLLISGPYGFLLDKSLSFLLLMHMINMLRKLLHVFTPRDSMPKQISHLKRSRRKSLKHKFLNGIIFLV